MELLKDLKHKIFVLEVSLWLQVEELEVSETESVEVSRDFYNILDTHAHVDIESIKWIFMMLGR